MASKTIERRKPRADDEMRPEYDFRGGVRGKHAARFAEGSNVVLLDPDVAAAFPTARAVNEALRALVPLVIHAKEEALRARKAKSRRSE
ncbi:MAG: hypothetical protein NTW86_07215 [Candidatus Sumerlaeota bacterium]|nr:hypothetical protein [Candidatus Sumerlaeota bacterium]